MTEFLMGAASMFTLTALFFVFRDYRRWLREEDAYRRSLARRQQMEPANGPWSNGRWTR